MGKDTLKDKIRRLVWNYIEAPIFGRVLKSYDIDLGENFMENLIDMYRKSDMYKKH